MDVHADATTLFVEHLVTKGLDGKTINTYLDALKRFERFMSTSKNDGALSTAPTTGGAGGCPTPILATQKDISNFKKWLTITYKSGTARLTLKLLSAFFRWAVDNHLMVDNPVDFIERPPMTQTPIKWLTTDEQNAVLREARRVRCALGNTPTETQQNTQLREYAIVLTFLRAGLRVEELCDMKVSDLTITPRKGHVYIMGKGDKDRTVPLCKELRGVLTRYLESRKDNPSPYVFPSQRSEHCTTRAIQHLIEGYAERLNMPHLTCHALRHTFGHDLAVAHIPLDVIARLMGHCKADGSPNIAMTTRYTAPGMSDLENAVETIAWD